ncbi:hypothetical protein D350_00920 [Enterococcus faecalis VC1B-1]|nr:hypothetical protein D350_00920 [Enterococcus faecalis VC1B-1]
MTGIEPASYLAICSLHPRCFTPTKGFLYYAIIEIAYRNLNIAGKDLHLA